MTPTIVLLAAVLTAQAKAPDGNWVKSVSKDDKFSFVMPTKPVAKDVVQNSASGSIQILEYSCVSNECLYKIEQTKVPTPILEDKIEAALAAVRDSVAKKTKLMDDRIVSVAGRPARRLTIEAPLKPGGEPHTIAMLVCVAGGDFYQVRVFALRPGKPPADVQRFFDGFEPKQKRETGERKGKP